ncbi:PREDICTED: cilia- and flagella-associated protein 58-like [Dinoponera quadriceps]|uniref:Cilia- and flagella-associated protein 58-like n=1 Tax=Dinoponera quadriceps TaxID=609295 RepID=A0A6P3WWE3_DINQU|nr:PREDICTED: cilia- and flagella-associated protein 58-like [Dinoponera quadriceps]
MMEMEMNADLDGDDGSESSQPSSEGSSASSTFCNLEKDYARITSEMKTNEALAAYESEYARLYESLYKAHRNEKELSEQCTSLKDEITNNTYKMYELKKTVEAHEDEIARLKQEVVNTTKLADAAHSREQNAQEVIENLRLNIVKLGQEIEQKDKQLAAEKDVAISKQKEVLLKERDRLVGEMEAMRQRLKNVSAYTEELERKGSATDHRMNEMQETLDMQLNEISREKRGRERAEMEVRQLQEEITVKKDELEAANASIEASANNAMRLESLLKEHRTAGEKMQKEIGKLMLKRMNLQTDLDNANVEIEKLEEELTDREKLLKSIKYDLNKTREDSTKCKFEKDIAEKRLLKADGERSRLEQDLRQAVTDVKNIEHKARTCRKEFMDERQRVEALLREKNTLARGKETALDRIKRMNRELLLSEHAKRKIERELDTLTQSSYEVKKQLEVVEKERDKCNLTAQELERQIEGHLNEVRLKQTEISDCKKSLAEAGIKYRQQQSLFEVIRAERNLYRKNLTETQEEVKDLRRKLKITSQQVEQLKEDIATKESNLVKQEFILGRIEKEKEDLKVDLRSCRMELSTLRREIEKMKREEKYLRWEVQQAHVIIGRRQKDIDNVMNERDILGTQLVRRNDELSLQYGRIKVLNTTLQRGETQYNQKLQDIRLLKCEVKRLRVEKVLLTKNIVNVSDLRQEVFYLNRDLAKERLKVTALEEEVQTPLNVHRWRKLEGTDPTTFELVKKVQILQKRILKMSDNIIDKEKKIKDVEKLYMNLRGVLSKQRDPQAVASVDEVRSALRKRGEKLKCLVAELNMYETQVGEYKGDMTKMANEMCELKKKYHAQKRKFQKMKERDDAKSSYEPILPGVLVSSVKFCGGGFNMTTSTRRNCFLELKKI